MKTIFKQTLFLLVMLCTTLIMSSCRNEEEVFKSSISGFYKADNMTRDGVQFILVYDFINSNTVVYYGHVVNSKNEKYWSSWNVVKTVPGHTGWYYDSAGIRQYTYIQKDNKIILTDGTIFTISGNTLIPDGSSLIYYKW